jgi:hypothetical protein
VTTFPNYKYFGMWAERKHNSMQKRMKPQVPSSPSSTQRLSLAFVNTRIPAHIIDKHFIVMLAKMAYTPAFLLHIAISATGVQVLVSGL